MAIRLSDGFKTALAGGLGYYDLLRDSVFQIYEGTQPANANAAPSGTLLATVTDTSGTLTAETRAIALISLTGVTTAETITSISINGIEVLGATVTYATSATATAVLLADAINSYRSQPDFNAIASSESVTIYAPKNTGIAYNNATIIAAGTAVWNGAASHFTSGAVAANATPYTWSSGNGRFGSGAGGNTAGVAAVNGLKFTFPADTNILSKSGTWTGDAVADGTAGWGRFVCRNRKTGAADSGAVDATKSDMRMDVTVGTSAAVAEAVVRSLEVGAGGEQRVNSFALTIGG